MWEAVAAEVGGRVIGSLLDNDAAGDRNDASLAWARENAAMQREFAQNGIRWRVEDAQKAGIHPLYALGAQTHSFAPTSFQPEGPDYSMGRAMSDSGQDISRAMQAAATKDDRAMSMMDRLALERAELENDLLRSQIATQNAQLGPPLPALAKPGPSSINSHLPPEAIVTKPSEIPASMPGDDSIQAGVYPDLRWSMGADGILTPMPAKEHVDDPDLSSPDYMEWWIRNRLLPTLSDNPRMPPRSMLPKGATHWKMISGGRWAPGYDTHIRQIEGR